MDDLAGTAGKAADAWRALQAYRLPDPGRATPATADVRAFATWMRRYFARCRDESLLDRARLADIVAPALRAGALPVPDALVLVGFDRFTPQQRELLKTLEDLGTRLRTAGDGRRDDVTARRVPLPDAEGEYRAAARWVRAVLASGTPGNTAVLVPQLHAHRRQLERIFDETLMPGSALPGSSLEGRPYNLAASPPFHRYPVIGAALDIAAVLSGTKHFERFSSLVRSCASRTSRGCRWRRWTICSRAFVVPPAKTATRRGRGRCCPACGHWRARRAR
jgi:hypothetical protein